MGLAYSTDADLRASLAAAKDRPLGVREGRLRAPSKCSIVGWSPQMRAISGQRSSDESAETLPYCERSADWREEGTPLWGSSAAAFYDAYCRPKNY